MNLSCEIRLPRSFLARRVYRLAPVILFAYTPEALFSSFASQILVGVW